MIAGRTKLIAWFKENKCPYFFIRRKSDKEGGNPFYSNKDEPGETMDTALRRLETCLSFISNGDFFIYCNDADKKTASKGRYETFFSISQFDGDLPTQQAATVTAVGTMSHTEVEALAGSIAEKKFTDLMLQQKLSDYERQLAELKRENSRLQGEKTGVWRDFMAGLTPYIGNIMGAIGIAPAPAVNGLDATPREISKIPSSKKLEDNMATDISAAESTIVEFTTLLAERYPDQWLTILKKLSVTLMDNPAKIDVAIQLL